MSKNEVCFGDHQKCFGFKDVIGTQLEIDNACHYIQLPHAKEDFSSFICIEGFSRLSSHKQHRTRMSLG